jgi:hypothetical protein
VYIFYVLLFMASMMAIADWRGDAAAASDAARADAVATQLASYHQQVLAFCQENVCQSGPVDPRAGMPWHMRDADIYGRTIRSAYDGNSLFVTFYSGLGAPIEKGRIADALVTKLHGAANAGRYNQGAGQVLRSMFRQGPVSALEQMAITVPSTVGGEVLEDGVPMVATKLDDVAKAPATGGCPIPATPTNPLPCAM